MAGKVQVVDNQCAEQPAFKEVNLVSRSDPFQQFNNWYKEGENDANQFMCFTTATKKGLPSCRILASMGMNEEGLKIYTNCNSTKAKEFKENPFACSLFYWPKSNRQIIIQGSVKDLDDKESTKMNEGITDRDCRVKLLMGDQDEVLSGYDEMVERKKDVEEKYKDVDPLPYSSNMKGYILIPTRFEFYQGHCNWQADRITFTKQSDSTWMLQRLMP